MASDAIHFLNVPPSREVAEQGLHAELRRWFAAEIGVPTMAQRFAWPPILARKSFLLSSPTGSGKTLAAFLPILSELLAQPAAGLQCLYVAPLKALCRDVGVNLKKTVRSISQMGAFAEADLRIGMRTGDTSQRVRRRHLRHPPSILLTTPESLAQMLAHPPGLDMLRTVRWLVLDEIHALVATKRGADLSVSVERLEAISPGIQRIGLSATCEPLDRVAEFLVGAGRCCVAAHAPDTAEKRFVIEPLFEDAGYSAGWLAALLERVEQELAVNRTTLIFTNTRNLAERLTWALRRRHPERAEEIAVHHSAISAARRRRVERRLKQGRLWTVVSSTSLELGIDIGAVDHVVFVHPPGGVVRLLQRVGRSGHRPGEPRRGLLLTASPAELIEAAVTAQGGRDGHIEATPMTHAPLDVLCQQLAGMAMTGAWRPASALELVRRAAPYRNLAQSDFDDCLDYLSGRHRDGAPWLPPRIRWTDDGAFTIADSRTLKLLRRNLGTILTEDVCAIRLRDPADGDESRPRSLGEVDQSYAERLQPGDRFVLDGRCLEMRKRDAAGIVVDEVFGRPQVPRWQGTGVPMSAELARRLFSFRAHAAEVFREGDSSLHAWLRREYNLGDNASAALAGHIRAQETISEVPTLDSLLVECVAMQSCVEYFVHTPLSRSANDALARVFVHRMESGGNRKIMALPADLGLYLVVSGEEVFAPEDWRTAWSTERFSEDLREHVRSSDLLRQVFSSVAQTGLMVMRNPLGRKRSVGGKDWVQRRLFEQVRAAASDFLLLRQSESEALDGICDRAAAEAFVLFLRSIPIHMRHLSQTSPFGESLLGGGYQASPIGAAGEQP